MKLPHCGQFVRSWAIHLVEKHIFYTYIPDLSFLPIRAVILQNDIPTIPLPSRDPFSISFLYTWNFLLFSVRFLYVWNSVFSRRHINHHLNVYRKQIAMYRFRFECTVFYTCYVSFQVNWSAYTWAAVCDSNHLQNLSRFAFHINFESFSHFPNGIAVFYKM